MEPRIIDDELLLRVQQWIMFDQDDRPAFERLCCPSICSHITKYFSKYAGSATFVLDLLHCQIQNVGGRERCPPCSILYRCADCAIEFESDAVHLKDGNVVVVITKWLDVGNGNSPSDPNWRRHLYPPSDGQPIAMPKDWVGTKRIYEGQAGKSQEMANRKIPFLLNSDTFRKNMHQITRGNTWSDHI